MDGCLNESESESVFLSDIWGVIIKHADLYDTIFIRASSKWLYKLCKEFRPFPKYHVLDQRKCMEYLIKNGSTSCLDYVKNALHFEWTINETQAAVWYGQVDVLKHLLANGCPFEEQTALVDCTHNECSLDMLKYLHESGITWQSQQLGTYDKLISDIVARNGHIDCLKYALETGCTDREVSYTPSMECLEFIVQNQFDWKGEARGPHFTWGGNQLNICEYAAAYGYLPILQYAHQNGAPLNGSAYHAARAGQLACLKYAVEHCEDKDFVPNNITTIECFKYLLERFGREKLETSRLSWLAIGSDIDYLKYILSLGIPLPTDDARQFQTLLSAAASNSTTDVMKFLFDHVPAEKMNQECQNLAVDLINARRSNIAGLELLFERNMASSMKFQRVAGAAISSNDIDTVKFVWEKFPNKEGHDMIQETLTSIEFSAPEIIDFLVEQGAKLTDEHLFRAASVGNLAMTAYLTRRGCQCHDLPQDLPNSLCVKYLQEHQLN